MQSTRWQTRWRPGSHCPRTPSPKTPRPLDDAGAARRVGRSVNTITADVFYDAEEAAWLAAVAAYQARTGRKFPTFTELLILLKSLGYRKADP